MTKCSGDVQITAQVQGPDGATLTAAFADQRVQTTVQNGQAALTLHFAEPRLWSPDDPYLYEGLLLLTQDGETDEIGTYFGIREITVGKVDGRDFPWILLNGKPVYLNGTLDQAYNPKGHFTYPDEEASVPRRGCSSGWG